MAIHTQRLKSITLSRVPYIKWKGRLFKIHDSHVLGAPKSGLGRAGKLKKTISRRKEISPFRRHIELDGPRMSFDREHNVLMFGLDLKETWQLHRLSLLDRSHERGKRPGRNSNVRICFLKRNSQKGFL